MTMNHEELISFSGLSIFTLILNYYQNFISLLKCRKRLGKIFFFALFFWGGPCYAQAERSELSRFGPFFYTEQHPNTLFLFGRIRNGDNFELRRALRSAEIKDLVLLSDGGSVWEALTMGGIIFDRQINTYIPDVTNDLGCFSACAFIFFAGANRIAKGSLGVHQVGFYTSAQDNQERRQGETQQVTQYTTSEVIGFLNEFKTPAWVFERMFRSREIYIFSADEVADINQGSWEAEDAEKINVFLHSFIASLSTEGSSQNGEDQSDIPVTNRINFLKNIQNLLNGANCSAGLVDGIWGPRSNNAATRFAAANSITYSGIDSLSREYVDLLSSDHFTPCPSQPTTTRTLNDLSRNWSFTSTCRRTIYFGGTMTVSGRRNEINNPTTFYDVQLSFENGVRYVGTIYRVGMSFTASLRQVSGRGTMRVGGQISSSYRTMVFNSIEGSIGRCNFTASSR
jgi:hypothetical protein